MATTTFAAIRDNYITLIEAITPSTHDGSDKKFKRSPRRYMLRDWAIKTGHSAVFRKFEIIRASGVADQLPHFDSDQIQRRERARISIAYPVDVAFYGTDERDDLDDVMRSDAKQVRDVLFDPDNYLAGQNAAIVNILGPDRVSENVWFQDLEVDFIYNEAQSI